MSNNIRNLLDKSKESAKLAIQIYNTPDSKFRVGSFVVLMNIARVSLLHAIFEKQNKDYYYYKQNGRRKTYVKIEGDKKARELEKSAREYFSQNSPILANIEFFIKIRNKIEHRFMPNVVNNIIGECQAFIINYEKTLVGVFGKNNCLSEHIFIPVQISEYKRKINPSKDEQKVIELLTEYRSSLSQDIFSSSEYSYGLYLIPKTANHPSENTSAIEFVKFDYNNPEEMEKYRHLIVAIKEKQVTVANGNFYRPSVVLNKINERGYTKNNLIDKSVTGLHSGWHTKMWKKYKVRKEKGNPDTNNQYCHLDKASITQDFVYTDEWIELLIEKEFEIKNK